MSRWPLESSLDELDGLMKRRETSDWRPALVEFLSDYILDALMKKALTYTLALVQAAIQLRCHSQNPHPEDAFVPFSQDAKPLAFNLKKWRHLVLTVGFTVEEPDKNFDVLLCGLYLPAELPLNVLTGFSCLLTAMLAMDYHVIKGIINLHRDEAYLLIELLNALQGENLVDARRYDPILREQGALLQGVGLRVQGDGPAVKVLHNPVPGGVRLPQVMSVLVALFSQMSGPVRETPV